ncbi:hypothetical protein CH333_05185 [candidate division WOR-3 bacterium JGI_Cruoil_03_44_89]|uniref:Uncharacterized protein n=1 Tax=candidate division WOR-3 bacterium JGI_Cruoil_03_44_89 TaxID=1973748 RepID=A0A235BVA8_UNCW3|nr:MAG: hypothetical protein CH333_05185 [candidate division WOR-3 bacterium JGI_Cruoil_03_44_89]
MIEDRDNISKILILFCVISGGILVSIVFTQNVFTDELSYYLPAAREIAKGRQLYGDFFFPQMPLSAIAFLPFSGGGWVNLFLARIVSYLLAVVSGVILLLYTFHLNKSKGETVYTGILWAGNAVLFYGSVQATQRAWVNLLNVLFLISFFLSLKRRKTIYSLLSGVCIGLSMSFRSVFFILFIIAIIFLLSKREWKMIPYIVTGFILGALPSLYYFLKYPDEFLFCNLLYHLKRSVPSFYWFITHRFLILLKVIIFPSNIVLFVLLAVAFNLKKVRGEEFMSLICAAVLFIFYYFLLTPTHFGYMTEIYPFILFFLLPHLGSLKGKVWSKWLLIIYISSYIPCSLMYSFTVRDWQKGYTISNARKITEIIEEVTDENDEVVSCGIQFGFLARRQTIPELAIPTYDIAARLDENIRERYHLTAYEDIPMLLQRNKPRLIVDVIDEKDTEFFRLDEMGYKKITEYNGVSIFLLSDSKHQTLGETERKGL